MDAARRLDCRRGVRCWHLGRMACLPSVGGKQAELASFLHPCDYVAEPRQHCLWCAHSGKGGSWAEHMFRYSKQARPLYLFFFFFKPTAPGIPRSAHFVRRASLCFNDRFHSLGAYSSCEVRSDCCVLFNSYNNPQR